jgi:hypothetical protein
MEKLYKLNRGQLLLIAAEITGSKDVHLYDPFTDQQLRDYIANKIITDYLTHSPIGRLLAKYK